jgi:N-acetyl-1-D-myo-inositol-2-amino-2-deoxy-alpha-D-glucopyranoside deacetylase
MMSANATLLAIFAHPDDEVFRCGGTLALLSGRGVRVQVLTATRGQAGSCGDPPLCSPQELGAVREAELRCACQALGIEAPRLLDYQDGTLAEVNEDEAVAQIMAVLRELQPQVLLTWPPHGLSGHPDHIAISRWATRAFDRATREGMGGSLALYHLAVPRSVAGQLGLKQLQATPDEQIAVTVDVGAAWEEKMAAIQCHRTQGGESPILKAPLERQRLFLGTEHFQRAAVRSGWDLLPMWLEQSR